MKRTIKATTIAWATRTSKLEEIGPGNTDAKAVEAITFSNNEAMGQGSIGWTRIGVARIEVDVMDDEEVVVNAVRALRNEQQHVRAEAEQQAMSIERSIQQLLAITNEPSAVES